MKATTMANNTLLMLDHVMSRVKESIDALWSHGFRTDAVGPKGTVERTQEDQEVYFITADNKNKRFVGMTCEKKWPEENWFSFMS